MAPIVGVDSRTSPVRGCVLLWKLGRFVLCNRRQGIVQLQLAINL